MDRQYLHLSSTVFVVERHTNVDDVYFTTTCSCKTNNCIHANVVENFFTDRDRPWLVNRLNIFCTDRDSHTEEHSAVERIDVSIDKYSGLVFDTIEGSDVLLDYDGTGRSIILTPGYDPGSFVHKAFNVKLAVHSTFHGRWVVVSGKTVVACFVVVVFHTLCIFSNSCTKPRIW